MTDADSDTRPRRLTARGAATRARILEAAAELIRAQGAAATTLDEIRAASGTSKSQLYQHFPDKDTLVRAVIALRGQEVLEFHRQHLDQLDSLRGLQRWRDMMVQRTTAIHGAYGCAPRLTGQRAGDQDEDARNALEGLFELWEELFAAGFERMRSNSTLREDADPAALATG